MRTTLLLLFCSFFVTPLLKGQNIFNPADPIIKYDASKPIGSAQRPDTSKAGLQKFVITPTNGISTGNNTWDATSFKSYFFNYNGKKFAFRLKFPKSYTNTDSASKRYPIMLFFHGAGEVGCYANGGIFNNEKQLALGAPSFMERVDKNQFDGFLLYPQLVLNDNSCWGNWGGVGGSTVYNALLKLMDSMVKYTRLDVDRVLLAGLSAGGVAAYNMAKGYPQRIAGIAPSAATGVTTGISGFVHIPIWFATGQKDNNPSSAKATSYYNTIKNSGADIRFSHYANVGHAAWTLHWKEADFVPYMNRVHKANPLVFFQRNEVCPDSSLQVKLGITAGFYAYEWQRNNVTIATRTGNVNTINDPATVASFTGNEIEVKNYGTYKVRFKRSSGSAWTVWSPKPAELTVKEITQAEAIQVNGLHSKVLPAPDGSTTVPLTLPEGFINYQWYRVSDNTLVSTERNYNAAAGTYKAKYAEPFGCGSSFSPNFKVVNANSNPKPNAVLNLVAVPADQNSIKLTWKDNATNEVGYEIYRSLAPGGPYTLIHITPRNRSTYTDATAQAGEVYYYIVRTVNNISASVPSNEATVKSIGDNTPPSAPANLQYRGSTIKSIFLRWQQSTDDDGIKRYDIYANGTKLISTTSTEIEVLGLDSLKLYAFTVKAVDNSENVSAASNQAVGYTHHQGFNYKYFNGTYSVLPDYNILTPIKSGYIDTITFGESFRTQINYYGILYTGFIYAPQTALYTFELNSDDGSKLYVASPYSHSGTAVVNNDSVHTSRTRSGTIQLTAGYHQIALAYFDRNGSERLQLFWSNNAGLAKEAIPKNFFSISGTTIPASPAAPQALVATALDHTSIRLNWQDKSNNETGFELSRSLTLNGTFTPVFTTASGQVQYIDSGLNAATKYFYRLRAIGLGGSSAYIIADATTQSAPLTPAKPTNLTAEFVPGGTVALSWADNASNETAYLVYRSAGNNGSFALLATLGANSTAYADNTVVNSTLYYYYVIARNASGNSTESNTVQVTTGNNPPVISPVDDIFVKAGSTVNRDFTVTDAAGDNITVSLASAPSFVTLSLISGNSYRLSASTSVNDIGTYPIRIIASDDKGGNAEKILSLTIADKNTRAVLVNFGHSSTAATAPWNNWLGTRAVNSTINNLKDEMNAATGFSITALTAWRSTAINGHITGDNSGIHPDTVLMGGIMDTALQLQFRVNGLNTAMRYNLVFTGSQNEGIEAISEYSSGTVTSRLDARYNTQRTANLNGLVPDANGRITVTIKRISKSSANYLNALVIEEYHPSVPVINPGNLFAEVTANGKAVSLSWSDRSSNEAATGGFILERAVDSTFKTGLITRTYAANTVTATDSEISPDQRYWYRIKAKTEANVHSAYSNRRTVTTAGTTIKVNFNYTVPPVEDSSWTNTLVSPTLVQSIGGVKDHTGNNTGIELSLEKIFNGEFNAGMSTGNNSGVAPDNALLANYWLDNTQLSTIRVSGLNHTRRYRFGFFGSSSPDGWYKGNYTATYTINGKTVYLNSWQNTTKIVYINDVAPDANGEIILDFSTTATALYGFNAGLIIHAYTADSMSSIPAVPGDSAGPIIDTPIIDSPSVEQYKVHVFPNPFMEVINVEFHNENTGGKIRTEIHDLNGRLIHRRDFSGIPQGNNTLSIFTGDAQFRHGTYIFSIIVDDKVVKTTKIIRASR